MGLRDFLWGLAHATEISETTRRVRAEARQRPVELEYTEEEIKEIQEDAALEASWAIREAELEAELEKKLSEIEADIYP